MVEANYSTIEMLGQSFEFNESHNQIVALRIPFIKKKRAAGWRPKSED